MQTAQFVQHFHIARIFFEQGPQRENADLRPARRHRGFLQHQIRLSMVRLVLQHLLDHLHRALGIFLHLALRFHHRDRRGRNVKQAFFG